MRRLIAVLALLLTGCSCFSSSPVASTSPSSGSVKPVSSPAPSSTPTQAETLARADFTCRLPVSESSTSGVNQGSFVGGFISFPAATFTPDPAGQVFYGQDGQLVTAATPQLAGAINQLGGPPFFDRSMNRWVPASSSQTTPDGAFYAYATTGTQPTLVGQVHVVDVAGATEKVFTVELPINAQGLSVADFDSNGVYLVADGFEQFPSGVWLMNASTGSVKQLSQVNFVEAVRGGYAWAARIDPRDPHPPQLQRSGTASDSVVRVDLATGNEKVWFYRPGFQVGLDGFDSGNEPVVDVTDPSGVSTPSETWLVDDPAAPVQLHAGSDFLFSPQGDGGRLWLGGTTGYNGSADVFLYTRTHGLQKVFSDPTHELSIDPVGFCR